jgi:hypothetical protein
MTLLRTKGSLVSALLLCMLAPPLLCGTPAAASPIIIDFENASDDALHIPNGYRGFNWDNFGAVAGFRGGYGTGIVSGEWTGFNEFENPAAMSREPGFNLYDGYFTAAWRDNVMLQVLGYRNGSQIYDTSWTLDTSGPALLSLNYFDVDLVRFITSGGVNVVEGGDGTHFVADDVRVAQTSIPAALPLFATALGGLGWLGWRHRQRNCYRSI